MQRNPSSADLISSKIALRQAKTNNAISLQFKANSLSRRKLSRIRPLSTLFLIIRKREQSLDSLLLMESAYSFQ